MPADETARLTARGAGGASRTVRARGSLAVATVILCLAALTGGSPHGAQAADESSWAYELWHGMMSPYCPGRTLAECPSPQADELRLWILTQAAAGAAREEVEASLYARFGDQIRTTPRAEGWGLAAYVIPVVAFVSFGGIVLVVLRRMVGRSAPEAESAVEPAESAVEPAESAAEPVELAELAKSDRHAAPIERGRLSDAELEDLVDEELGA
jgi:cytochrome c-type biogenesis protein CcmH/NrfF